MSFKDTFARAIGVQSGRIESNPPAKAIVQKRERGFDIATAKPGFAHIFKKDKPKKNVNHSPLAWQVRAKGLIG